MEDDLHAIRTLITRQFDALDWSPSQAPDFTPVLDGFLAGASMYPSRRPLAAQTPAAFCARLAGLREDGTLGRFSERPLGIEIGVFGNVAVALAGCEMLENGARITRDVSALLLVKEEGHWRIACQAWDMETPERPLPPRLAAPHSSQA